MAIEKYKLSEENRIESIEFKESQIYHLVSLILTCIYIPFDMMYVRHILSSFTNHYNIDLSNDGNCYSNNPNIMKDIFDKDMYVETIRNSKNNLAKRF